MFTIKKQNKTATFKCQCPIFVMIPTIKQRGSFKTFTIQLQRNCIYVRVVTIAEYESYLPVYHHICYSVDRDTYAFIAQSPNDKEAAGLSLTRRSGRVFREKKMYANQGVHQQKLHILGVQNI